MATIDLIVLGILKKESLSAYDIQKLVEYRNISRWVKISTPSIYKKVIQLEEKGYIQSSMVKEGKMAEKAVYTLTEAGEQEFEKLMPDPYISGFQCGNRKFNQPASGKTAGVLKPDREQCEDSEGVSGREY